MLDVLVVVVVVVRFECLDAFCLRVCLDNRSPGESAIMMIIWRLPAGVHNRHRRIDPPLIQARVPAVVCG